MRTLAAIPSVPPARTHRSENFPVAGRLLWGAERGRVLAFYAFARAADDVADDPGRSPERKLARLEAFEAALDGRDGAPEGAALRAALGSGAPGIGHARTLLGAFRQDARGARYETWADLRAYCAMSADPVGRFLLSLRGEGPGAEAPSDALCTALQVLNHLQDLRADRDRLGRVYLPAAWLAAAGAAPRDLSARALSPGARAAVDRALDACDALLDEAAALPGRIAHRGLRVQAAATHALARGLSARLRAGDPLAARVAPGRADVAAAVLGALLGRAAR